MADNVQITAGSGTTIATDDVGGFQHQRVKLSLGADGTAVDAVAGSGVVGSGVQRVTLASDDPAVVDLAAIEVLLTGIDADTDAVKTAIQIMDDWDNTASDGCSVSGDVAHDGADAGEPVKIGMQARTSWPVAVANSDRVNGVADKYGRQLVTAVPRDLKGSQNTTITASTAETTIVAAGASGVFNDLYALVLTNTSATDVVVTIRDATAGTTRFVFAVKAGQTGGIALPAADAHKQAVAANNWTAQCSGSVSSLVITAMFTAMVDA